jgi:hypothetical protein
VPFFWFVEQSRRSYPISIQVNGRSIVEVVIDSHYEIKHSGSIDDELILKLVNTLNGKFYKPEMEKGDFQYFVADPLEYLGTRYRLVWLLENEKLYIGVVNTFRR